MPKLGHTRQPCRLEVAFAVSNLILCRSLAGAEAGAWVDSTNWPLRIGWPRPMGLEQGWAHMHCVHCTVYTVPLTLLSVNRKLYSINSTVYSLQCVLYTVQLPVYSLQLGVQCTVTSVHFRAYSVQCTLHIGNCILFTVHCRDVARLKSLQNSGAFRELFLYTFDKKGKVLCHF